MFQVYFEGYPWQNSYISATMEAVVVFCGVVVVVVVIIVLRCLGLSPLLLEDFVCLVIIVIVVVVVRCIVVETSLKILRFSNCRAKELLDWDQTKYSVLNEGSPNQIFSLFR